MARQARKKSNSNIYHIMLRGINRQQIFEDEEDRIRFLETLQTYKAQCRYKIYAYCLMGNHIHLLLKEGQEDLTQILKRIAAGGQENRPLVSSWGTREPSPCLLFLIEK